MRDTPKISLIDTIKTIASEIYDELGSGLPEKIYSQAIQVVLRSRSIPYDAEKVIEVKYRGHFVGEIYLDLLIGTDPEKLMLEIKATNKLTPADEQQIKNYMRILQVKTGLLINFCKIDSKGMPRLEMKVVSA